MRQNSRNETLDDFAAETSQKREGRQQVYYALSIVIRKKKTLRVGEDEVVKKKTLREVEDVVAKQDGASSNKQTQNFDVLDHQDVEVSSMNKPSSMSMVETLTVQPTLILIQLVVHV
jgi:hypothetical protein